MTTEKTGKVEELVAALRMAIPDDIGQPRFCGKGYFQFKRQSYGGFKDVVVPERVFEEIKKAGFEVEFIKTDVDDGNAIRVYIYLKDRPEEKKEEITPLPTVDDMPTAVKKVPHFVIKESKAEGILMPIEVSASIENGKPTLLFDREAVLDILPDGTINRWKVKPELKKKMNAHGMILGSDDMLTRFE